MDNLKHKHREGKMLFLENGELKIKSTELVDIINDFRKVEAEAIGKTYTELAHYDFYKKIKKELDTLKFVGVSNDGNISEITYLDSKNRIQPCFELNRDGMLQMLNSESALVRYKTIEYINKLEGQLKGQALNTSKLSKELQAILMLDNKTLELEKGLEKTNTKFDNFIEDLPLIGDEPDELLAVVRCKGTEVLGGKDSQAYKNKSLSTKVFRNIWKHVHEQFNVKKYKAIKRKYLGKAKEIVQAYEPPFYLQEEIIKVNDQIDFKEVI